MPLNIVNVELPLTRVTDERLQITFTIELSLIRDIDELPLPLITVIIELPLSQFILNSL